MIKTAYIICQWRADGLYRADQSVNGVQYKTQRMAEKINASIECGKLYVVRSVDV